MAFILTGDTHGILEIEKIEEYFQAYDEYTKEDYLIILGDVGVLWNEVDDKEVQRTLNSLPVTTLWIDGNHENFDLINSYPVERWKGGNVHFISDSIIHLMRGQVFSINGRKFFTFGGGNSIDKAGRYEGVSWWADEMPSNYEYESGLENLDANDWTVDYVLTHTCPSFVAEQLVAYMHPGEEELQKYFDNVAEALEFERWFFGHWHTDETIDNFTCVYNDVFEIE